jgi:hypothetical protein
MNQFYFVPTKNEIPLLLEAKELADKLFVEKLDCTKSFSRKATIEKTFDEIIDLYQTTNNFKFFTVIVRNQFLTNEIAIEVCLSVASDKNVEWFIYCYVNLKHLNYLVEKFNLKIKE